MKLFKKIKSILTMASGREESLLEKYKIGEEDVLTETVKSAEDIGSALKSVNEKINSQANSVSISKEGLKISWEYGEQLRLAKIAKRTKNKRIKNKLIKRINKLGSNGINAVFGDGKLMLYGIDLSSGESKTSYVEYKLQNSR